MAAGEEKLRLVLAAVDKTAAPIRRVNRRIEEMTKPVRKVQRALRSLYRESGLPNLGRQLARVGRIASRVGLAIGGAAAALGAITARVASRGDEIAKLSRQIGIGAEAFQEFEFAADRAGVSSATFRQSLRALSKRVGELQAGKGALSTLLGDSELGRQLRATTSTEEALERVSAAIASIEDPTRKAALASAAFSRSGLDMIRLANEGSQGIAALRAEARSLGLVLSEDALRGAEETQDAFANLRAVLQGIQNTIGKALFPVVVRIAERIKVWAVANRELISTRIEQTLARVVSVGADVFAFLQRVIPPTIEFVDRIGGLRTVAIVVGLVMAATLLPAIVAIGSAMATIGGVAVTAGAAIAAAIGPVGAIVLGVSAAVGVATAAIAANWESVAAVVTGTIDAIVEKATSLIPSLPEPVRRFLGFGGGSVDVGAAESRAATAAEGAVRSMAQARMRDAQATGQEIRNELTVQVEDRRVRAFVKGRGGDVELDEEELAGGTALAPA